MKKLPYIINGALFVAIAVLYVLFFTRGMGSSSRKLKSNDTSDAALSVANGGIVYINIDTVLNNYKMYLDKRDDLQKKLETSEMQLANNEKQYRKEVDDFKYKIDRGLVTRSEADEIQQSLAVKEQNLMQLQNDLRTKLAEEEQVAHRLVLNSIMEYMKTMENSNNYQFVLGTTFGGNILYANENLDITQDVIKGLNKSYKKEDSGK